MFPPSYFAPVMFAPSYFPVGGGSGGGTCTDPGIGNVRLGVSYEIDSVPLTGTLSLPDPSQVLAGVMYGAGGTQYTGTLVVPGIGPPPGSDLQDRLLADLQVLIFGLDLIGSSATGSIAGNVYVRTLDRPQRMTMDYPAILLATDGLEEEEGPGNFEEDEVWYPIGIYVLNTAIGNPDQQRADYRAWRRTIARALRGLVNPPVLPNTPEVIVGKLKNLPVTQVKIPEKEWVVSSMVSLWQTFEARERNAPV